MKDVEERRKRALRNVMQRFSRENKLKAKMSFFQGESKMPDSELFVLKPAFIILILTLSSTGQMGYVNLLEIHMARNGNQVV